MPRSRDEIMQKLLSDDYAEWVRPFYPQSFERINDGANVTYIWHCADNLNIAFDAAEMLSPSKFQNRLLAAANKAVRKPTGDTLVAISALVCALVEEEEAIITPEEYTDSLLRDYFLAPSSNVIDMSDLPQTDSEVRKVFKQLDATTAAIKVLGQRWVFRLEGFHQWMRVTGVHMTPHALGRTLRQSGHEHVRLNSGRFWLTKRGWSLYPAEGDDD